MVWQYRSMTANWLLPAPLLNRSFLKLMRNFFLVLASAFPAFLN